VTTLPPGDLDIGPSNGRLRLRTFRQGLAAKAGHDLVLQVTQWRGQLHVPADAGGSPSLEVEIDLRTLDVVEGTGGVKPLSERDKDDIRKAMQKPLRTDAHPLATFRSTEVRVDGDRATLTGDLSLAGQSHPVRLEVERAADGTLTATTQIVQTTWGVKPYTGFLGALKLRDAVDVEVELRLPV
jgi:polyisoprenoid-binding protein YceI